MNNRKRYPRLFKFIKSLVRFVYPKMTVLGWENLPEEPSIIIANHCQLHGPIACELYLPKNFYTWCAAQMMTLKDVPGYAYSDFWSQKPRALRPFYKLAAHLIAPLSVVIFNSARTIAVHRDRHLLSTLRDSISLLQEGNHIVIFPEEDKPHNHILYDFQEGFVDVARLYHKHTGREISFVPLYIAPKLKQMHFGAPIPFSADTPSHDERRRICDALMRKITDIAVNLPEHTVIPYRNISKRDYPTNVRKEEKS